MVFSFQHGPASLLDDAASGLPKTFPPLLHLQLPFPTIPASFGSDFIILIYLGVNHKSAIEATSGMGGTEGVAALTATPGRPNQPAR